MSKRVKFIEQLMQSKSKLKGCQKQPLPKRWNIIRGDTVQVIDRKHPEFGKQGKVFTVIKDELKVIVENVNLVEKEIPADLEKGTPKETRMVEDYIHYSNLQLVDPVTGFPTKITWSFLEDGTKVRISKKSGAIIPKPRYQKMGNNILASEDSDTTKDEDVWATTYVEKTSKWKDMTDELLKALEENGMKRLEE